MDAKIQNTIQKLKNKVARQNDELTKRKKDDKSLYHTYYYNGAYSDSSSIDDDRCKLNKDFQPIGNMLLSYNFHIDSYQRYLATDKQWENHFFHGLTRLYKKNQKGELPDGYKRLVGFFILYDKHHNCYGVVDGHNRLESISLNIAIWRNCADRFLKQYGTNLSKANRVKLKADINKGQNMLIRNGETVVQLPKAIDDKQKHLNKIYKRVIYNNYLTKNKTSNRWSISSSLTQYRNELYATNILLDDIQAIQLDISNLCPQKDCIKDPNVVAAKLADYFHLLTYTNAMRPFVVNEENNPTKARKEAIDWYNHTNGNSCPMSLQEKIKPLFLQDTKSKDLMNKWTVFTDNLHDKESSISKLLNTYYQESGIGSYITHCKRFSGHDVSNITSVLLSNSNDNPYYVGHTNLKKKSKKYKLMYIKKRFLDDVYPLAKIHDYVLNASNYKQFPKAKEFKACPFRNTTSVLNIQIPIIIRELSLFAGSRVLPMCYGLYHSNCTALQLELVLLAMLRCEERYRIMGHNRTHYHDESNFSIGPEYKAWHLNSASDDKKLKDISRIISSIYKENTSSTRSFVDHISGYSITPYSRHIKRDYAILWDVDSRYYQHFCPNYSPYLELLRNNVSHIKSIPISRSNGDNPMRLYNNALICTDNLSKKDLKDFSKEGLKKQLKTLEFNKPLIKCINKYGCHKAVNIRKALFGITNVNLRHFHLKDLTNESVIKSIKDALNSRSSISKKKESYILALAKASQSAAFEKETREGSLTHTRDVITATIPENNDKNYRLPFMLSCKFNLMCLMKRYNYFDKTRSQLNASEFNLMNIQFECFTGWLAQNLGYSNVMITRKRHDYGADVIAMNSHHQIVAFQSKRYPDATLSKNAHSELLSWRDSTQKVSYLHTWLRSHHYIDKYNENYDLSELYRSVIVTNAKAPKPELSQLTSSKTLWCKPEIVKKMQEIEKLGKFE